MTEITLKITSVNGEPTAKELISRKETTEILQCSPNTAKKYARQGLITYFLVDNVMNFFKPDVLELRAYRIKQQAKKLKQLQK